MKPATVAILTSVKNRRLRSGVVIYIVVAKISSLRNPYVTGKMTIVF